MTRSPRLVVPVLLAGVLLLPACSSDEGAAPPPSTPAATTTAATVPTAGSSLAPSPAGSSAGAAGTAGTGQLPADQLDEAALRALLVPAAAAPEGFAANPAVAAATEQAPGGGDQVSQVLEQADVDPPGCKAALTNVPGTDPATQVAAAFAAGGSQATTAPGAAPRALVVEVLQSFADAVPADYVDLLANPPEQCDQLTVTLPARGEQPGGEAHIAVEPVDVPQLGEVTAAQRTTVTAGGQEQVSQNVVAVSGHNVLLMSFSGAQVDDAERDAFVRAAQQALG